MKKLVMLFIMVVSVISIYSSEVKEKKESTVEKKSAISSEDSLNKLIEGNKRYISGKAINPDRDKKRREEIANAQHPFVVILTCSDSRVSPEVIFDQGLGDIFEIRNAGNLIDDVVLGSIEYAAEHLQVPLVVVMGHERCGAVSAAVAGGEQPGHISALTEKLKDVVAKVKTEKGDLIDNAVNENIDESVKKIIEDKPIMEELIKEGKVKVIGAYYDLDSGEVKFTIYYKMDVE